MKKLAYIFISLVSILSMSACRIERDIASNDTMKNYTLNLHDFQCIKNYSNCDIHFTQSSDFKVVLKASQRWYDNHTFTVSRGELVIAQKEEKKQKGITILKFNYTDDDAELWISAPSISAVSTVGSGDFYCDSDITGQNLELSISGSGDSYLKNVTLTDNLTYIVAGSGDIKTGSIHASNASFSISGSGDIQSKLTGVDTTEVTIAGSGDGTLDFDHCRHADISISGSGDITLSGSLHSLSKNISGSGDIDTDRLQLGGK